MNLEKLFEMQRVLDERIIKEKGLEGQDLLENTVLALQAELVECANEWRGFKHWSNDQKPRYERKCHACKGIGGFILGNEPEDCEMCLYCSGTGIESRPLLEEYVDSLHFILSIGNQINIQRKYQYHPYKPFPSITRTFRRLIALADQFEVEMDMKDQMYLMYFHMFIGLGEMLGFTWEQIEAAYMDKNKVNHERQANGY